MFSFKPSDNPAGIIKSRDNKLIDNKIVYVHDLGVETGRRPEGKEFFNSIQLPPNAFFEPVPKVKRSVNYICSGSGAGKSYYAGTIARNFHKAFKTQPEDIMLFKPTVQEDVAYKGIPMVSIAIDETLLTDPITLDMISDGNPKLILFDDTEAIHGKKIREAVKEFQDQVLLAGRKPDISCVVINHLITDYKNTRVILNEMTTLTIFSNDVAYDAVKYVCTKYIGLPKSDVEKIMKLPSRWVTISRPFPKYVMSQDQMYMLGIDDLETIYAQPTVKRPINAKDFKNGKINKIYEPSSDEEEDLD